MTITKQQMDAWEAGETYLRNKIKKRDEEIERLKTENWQLKGELGYPVPGHIPEGPFKCGLCEAKTNELLQLQEKLVSIYEMIPPKPKIDYDLIDSFKVKLFDRLRQRLYNEI